MLEDTPYEWRVKMGFVRSEEEIAEEVQLRNAKQEGLDMGIKFDKNKLRYELLPWGATTDEIVRVYTVGARKYNDRNWERGMQYSRFLGATFRHIAAWVSGETVDSETKCHHLASAIFSLIALLHYELHGIGDDDRPCQKVK